jgi:hypothetical protein
MAYTVEVRRRRDDVSAAMNDMRTWLDRNRFEPDTFRLSYFASDVVFQVEFKIENVADAFAQAFDGRKLIAADPVRSSHANL